MTASATAAAPTGVPTSTVFHRAATAELARLLTIRSTWWSLLAGSALMLFIGAAAGSDHAGEGAAPIWVPAEIAILPGQFAFVLLVLLAVTGEYSTGAIRSSLQWVPRRGVLLAARLLVPVAFATACAVVVGAATALVAWAFVGESAEVVPVDIARSLAMIGLVVAAGGVLTVGLGLLLRSTAGTLTMVFLLLFGFPVMLGNSGIPWLIRIAEHMPGSVLISLLAAIDEPRPASTIVTVLAAWAVAVTLAGGWSLLRRDIT